MKKFNKIVSALLVVMLIIGCCSGFVYASSSEPSSYGNSGPTEDTRLYHIDLSVDCNLTFSKYVNGVLETKSTVATIYNPSIVYVADDGRKTEITLEANTSVDTDNRSEFMMCGYTKFDSNNWYVVEEVTNKETARHNGNFAFGNIATVTYDLVYKDPWTGETITWVGQEYREVLTLDANVCPNYSKTDETKYGYDILISAEYLEELVTSSLTITKEFVGIDESDIPEDLYFIVSSDNGYYQRIDYSDFTDGVYILTNLAAGVYYIAEYEYDVEGYACVTSGDWKAVVPEGEDGEASLTNTYTQLLSGLTITKQIVGLDDIPENLSFTITGPNGFEVEVSYDDFVNGMYTLTDLVPGTYHVKENNAEVHGYILSVTGDDDVDAVVTYDEYAYFNIVNTYTPETIDITVNKVYEDVPESVSKPDVVIALYADGALCSTAELGENTANGWTYTWTNLNKYNEDGNEVVYAVDEYAVDGYEEYSNDIWAPSDSLSSAAGLFQTSVDGYIVTNTWIPVEEYFGNVSILVTKIGEHPTYGFVTLSGATFAIYDSDGTEVAVGTSDSNGLVQFDLSKTGTYHLVETAAPDGYEKDDTVWTIEVIKPSTPSTAEVVDGVLHHYYQYKVVIDSTETNTLTVVNYLSRGTLDITKVIEGITEIPEDLSFTVTGPNDFNVAIAYSEMTNGRYILDNILPGTYTITENNAGVDGYYLTATGTGDVEVVGNEITNVTITNKYTQKLGSLTIAKIFSGLDDDEIPEDLIFEIVCPEHDLDIIVKYSDFVDGSYTLTDLAPGRYEVTEVHAEVDGYNWTYSGEGWVSVVAESNTEVTIVNKYVPDVPDIPKTGDTFSSWLYVVLIALAGTGIALLVIPKKKH